MVSACFLVEVDAKKKGCTVSWGVNGGVEKSWHLAKLLAKWEPLG